ncbi:EamA family transporter [Lusitaniella coriacea]|uniref:EamA family transporter n=1 Tax=Lusitaniella coriacea TaxID=1983105 RepID=UPI003CF1051A
MTWFLFAFATAFFESLRDVLNKYTLKNANEYAVALGLNGFSALFLLSLLPTAGIPIIGQQFWLALGFGASLNAIAYIIFIKAIKLSDLSKIAPLTTFTPLFLLITSPVLVGEFPNGKGLLGILLVVIGAYTLNIRQLHKGFFAPFQALWQDRGAKFVLGVAFLWSLTSNFDKIGVQNSSPIFWAFANYSVITVLIVPMALYQRNARSRQGWNFSRTSILIGLCNAIAVACQMNAMSLTLVAYTIAIKRTSAVFSVLFGHFLFKEKGLRERLVGAAIMVMGVVAIALS